MPAWTRYLNVAASLEVTVTDITGTRNLRVENLEGLGLRMSWAIQRSFTSAEDGGEILVYNLGRDAVSALSLAQRYIKQLTYRVKFNLGWDGKVGLLYEGIVKEIDPEIRDQNDIITRFTIGNRVPQSELDPKVTSVFQNYFEAGFKVIAELLGAKLSKQFIDAVKAHPVTATSETLNAVIGSDPRSDMDALVSGLGPQYTWTIQNGFVYLLNGGLFADTTPASILSPNSGLLSWAPQEGGGIQANALADPSLLPGRQIILQDGDGKTLGGGPLRVESISWTGDTADNSTMSVIGRKLQVV